MEFKIPQPLKEEHEELHAELVKVTEAGGETGAAANTVAKLLHPHFEKEEAYALPPLGLLFSVSQGKVAPEMGEVLTMTDRLKAELPQMVEEHKTIIAALRTLSEAGLKEERPHAVNFAKKLMLHAQTEEEVLYPTSILIGECLKIVLKG